MQGLPKTRGWGQGARVLEKEAVFQPTQLRHQWILLPPTPSTGPDTAQRRSPRENYMFRDSHRLFDASLEKERMRRASASMCRSCWTCTDMGFNVDTRLANGLLLHRIVMGIPGTDTDTSTFEQEHVCNIQAERERALPTGVCYFRISPGML